MGSLQLKIICIVGLVLVFTAARVHGQKTLRELEKSLTSKIENLHGVVRGQGEEIKRQGDRIQQLENEIIKLNETNQILTKKISSLEKFSEAGQPVVSTSATHFQKIPRTCDELRTLNPFAQSGLYSIDPDGPNNGEEPIQVYCNTITGTTKISHDAEDLMQVSKCSSPGCYSKTVSYNVSMTQIVALINLSKTCKQFIQIDCIAAPLEFRNKNNAWWNDRNGVARYVWSGDNATMEHTCECGLHNDCNEPSLKCNCDSFAPELQTDKGYITDMSSLPVTKLNFGRNKYSTSKASYTLGKLECSGRHQLKNEPSSCEDLWRSGSTLSGIVLLQISNSLTAVFCDFSKIPGQLGFEKRIGRLGTNTSQEMFQAFLTEMKSEETVQFENITINVGNAFDSRVFKAPVPGVYSFTFKGWLEYDDYYNNDYNVQIHKNGNQVYQAQSLSSSSEQFAQVTLNLEAGDRVSVYLPDGSIIPGSGKDDPTTFSGVLLKKHPF